MRCSFYSSLRIAVNVEQFRCLHVCIVQKSAVTSLLGCTCLVSSFVSQGAGGESIHWQAELDNTSFFEDVLRDVFSWLVPGGPVWHFFTLGNFEVGVCCQVFVNSSDNTQSHSDQATNQIQPASQSANQQNKNDPSIQSLKQLTITWFSLQHSGSWES